MIPGCQVTRRGREEGESHYARFADGFKALLKVASCRAPHTTRPDFADNRSSSRRAIAPRHLTLAGPKRQERGNRKLGLGPAKSPGPLRVRATRSFRGETGRPLQKCVPRPLGYNDRIDVRFERKENPVPTPQQFDATYFAVAALVAVPCYVILVAFLIRTLRRSAPPLASDDAKFVFAGLNKTGLQVLLVLVLVFWPLCWIPWRFMSCRAQRVGMTADPDRHWIWPAPSTQLVMVTVALLLAAYVGSYAWLSRRGLRGAGLGYGRLFLCPHGRNHGHARPQKTLPACGLLCPSQRG